MGLNKTNLICTMSMLEKLKPNEYFNMNTHWLEIQDDLNPQTCGSIVGYAAMKLDKSNILSNYKTPDLVTEKMKIRWSSWAFDFFNIKHEAYDYLFSKRWAHKDNTVLGAICRIQHYLKHGLPPFPKKEMLTHNYPLSYRPDIPQKKEIPIYFELIEDFNDELTVTGGIYSGEASHDLLFVRFTDRWGNENKLYIGEHCIIKKFI